MTKKNTDLKDGKETKSVEETMDRKEAESMRESKDRKEAGNRRESKDRKDRKEAENRRETKKIVMENVLPQNILPMGEHVEEDKNIYISQSVYKEIHKFTENKLTNESGGMLIGNVIEEFGKTNIIIQGFVEAKYCEATPTTLKFTHETWEYVHAQISEKYEQGKIVGWIHTHPDFGIFLSEYDKFIQENFFREAYQIAYVVDPIQNIEGFYFWIHERIEKCKGFYIYDKTGEKIELESVEKGEAKGKMLLNQGDNTILCFLGAAFVIVSIIFAIICSNLLKRMEILEKRQENLVESVNQSMGIFQQQIYTLQSKIDGLQNQIDNISVPAEESMEESAAGSSEESSGEAAEESEEGSSEESTGEAAEESAAGSSEESTGEGTEESTEESAEESSEENSGEAAEEDSEESTGEGTEESTAESAEGSSEESSGEAAEESTAESAEGSSEESSGEAAEESTEESTAESVRGTASGSMTEETLEEASESAAGVWKGQKVSGEQADE